MKQTLKKFFYPINATRKIFFFFLLSLLPTFLFSMLLNGINAYGEQNVSNLHSDTVLVNRLLSESSFEEFSLEFNNSKEEIKKVTGSSYSNSEYILRTSTWVTNPTDGVSSYCAIYFAQTSEVRDEFVNYHNQVLTSFTNSSKEGVYVSEEYLNSNNLSVGQRVYLRENTEYSLEIIGSYKSIEARENDFYIVDNDLSNLDFNLFDAFGFYSLHTLNKNIDLNYSLELSTKIDSTIQTKATALNSLIGDYQKILKTGEIFAVVTSIAVSILLFYSVLGRGARLKNIHHIQYVYYKNKSKVTLNFILENLLNFILAVLSCLIISAVILLIVYLKYKLIFFISTLAIITVLVDGILVILASLLSFFINSKNY